MESTTGEHTLMMMVSLAGGAKSSAYEAIAEAEEGRYAEAERLLQEARKLLVEAHQRQTGLIVADVSGEPLQHLVLTIHAMDLTMSAATEIEMAERFVRLLRKVDR